MAEHCNLTEDLSGSSATTRNTEGHQRDPINKTCLEKASGGFQGDTERKNTRNRYKKKHSMGSGKMSHRQQESLSETPATEERAKEPLEECGVPKREENARNELTRDNDLHLGDPLHEKHSNMIRIYSQNINGISIQHLEDDFQYKLTQMEN